MVLFLIPQPTINVSQKSFYADLIWRIPQSGNVLILLTITTTEINEIAIYRDYIAFFLTVYIKQYL